MAISLDLEAGSVVAYATAHNDVPVVRGIQIGNDGADSVGPIVITFACNPPFARGTKRQIERLGPGESRTLSDIDLAPDHAYLKALNEAEPATLTVEARVGDQVMATAERRVEVLAYEQWAGTRTLVELLAAFVMPNSPAVDQILGRTAGVLRNNDAALVLDGYKTKSRDNVWKQVSAIYSVISTEAIEYALPPASFSSDGQKIRDPERILRGRVATCLDMSVLFAACLEQAGLKPIIVIVDGHAFVGVWLIDTCFATPVTDDAQAVRKRVQSGELMVFETTGACAGSSMSLRRAMPTAAERLEDADAFRYAVDVARAREHRIRPMPSRGDAAVPTVDDASPPAEPQVEAPPALPELDPALLPSVEENSEVDTPDARLTKWKRKLLDLSLRNRLLNFRATKTTFRLLTDDLTGVVTRLEAGSALTLRPAPPLMEGGDPRDAATHRARTGDQPLVVLAGEALGKGDLIVDAAQDKIEGRLLETFTASQTGLEEGGANTLFLAVGMLQWQEDEKAEKSHLAPILLFPITMTRQSVRSGFRIVAHDDDPIVNPTLLQKLKEEFAVSLPSFSPLPTTGEGGGVDIAAVLQSFRLAVREIPGWEVKTTAHIGLFSFTKYLMWLDLQARADLLKENEVVAHLIDRPGAAFPSKERVDAKQLDDRFKPNQILAPLAADSSQLVAIASVGEGSNVVINGPPGGGKSQTIVNIITHVLGTGRTALFVSEKMAALEVVKRRLGQIGIGNFCLELHSAKAKKVDVVAQLAASLESAGAMTPDLWEYEAERLALLRDELNAVVRALHRHHANQLTVYQAIGTTAGASTEDLARFDWPSPDQHTIQELDQLRGVTRHIQALGAELSGLSNHPLGNVGAQEWGPTWEDAWKAAITNMRTALAALDASVGPLCKSLGITEAGHSVAQLTAIDHLADALLGVPAVAPGIIASSADSDLRVAIEDCCRHGEARDKAWDPLDGQYLPSLAMFDAKALDGQWRVANAKWAVPRWFATRAVRKILAPARKDGRPPEAGEINDLLGALETINREDKALSALRLRVAPALGQLLPTDGSADWNAIRAQTAWAARLGAAIAEVAGTDVAFLGKLQGSLGQLASHNRDLFRPHAPLGAGLLAYRAAWKQFGEALHGIEKASEPVVPILERDPGGALQRLDATMLTWQRAAREVRPWCRWRGARKRALELGLKGLVDAIESGKVGIQDVPVYFEVSYQAWWLKKVIDQEPALREFSSGTHQQKITEFRELDRKFQSLIQRQVIATLSSQVPAQTAVVPTADSEIGRLRREMNKKRAHMPVRQLVQALPTLLPRLKPCMLMSPLSIAQYLDPKAMFDVIIFDEASQIPVADAIGAIARGKQLVVVGDPLQLPPTNFFQKTEEGEESEPTDIEDLESILDECLAAGLPTYDLKWHYRSRHESLIHFSNTSYYSSSLITFPSPATRDTAVSMRKVQGIYDRGGSRTNRREAEEVVKAIEAHFLNSETADRSLGVVTFNLPQQMLITELLDERRRANDKLDRAIARHTYEPLFVKNLEAVQGDERSYVFFSITYGPDRVGRTTMTFGPLSQDGGHRRLNVAASRAREQVVIFSSLLPEQIDLTRVGAKGAQDLKRYLDFALRGPVALDAYSSPTNREPDSPFEVMVANALRARGWTVHPQVGCSQFRIDLGVVDPRAPGRYLVGVECDGRAYHSAATARDRDRLRQEVLEQLGWRIHRIWSTDWWHDPRTQIDRLHEKLQAWAREDPPDTPVTESASPPVHQAVIADRVMGNESRAQTPFTAYRHERIVGRSIWNIVDPIARSAITADVLKLTTAEGPIAEFVLLDRIARAWGNARTGNRIVEGIRSAYPRHCMISIEGDVSFLWPVNVAPGEWTGFRVADDAEESRRHFTAVCREELANIAAFLLRNSGSMPEGDLARQVARTIGIARLGSDGMEHMARVFRWMQDEGRIALDGKTVRI